jgi:stalled ribosome rescue protein Dom34
MNARFFHVNIIFHSFCNRKSPKQQSWFIMVRRKKTTGVTVFLKKGHFQNKSHQIPIFKEACGINEMMNEMETK